MVFNQLLWSIHSKVISKLQEVKHVDLNGLAPCDDIPTETNVFIKHFEEIIKEYNRLKTFLTLNDGSETSLDKFELSSTGLYYKSFCNGVFNVLESLNTKLFKIEKFFLLGISGIEIHKEFGCISGVLCALNSAVEKLKDERYRGCKVLDLCESFINSESSDIKEVFIEIQQFCLKQFYIQIRLWLIQTLLYDPHNEFFIKASGKFNGIIALNSECPDNSMDLRSIGQEHSVEFFSMKYEVDGENLPQLIPFSVAVKILFIGESLRMCQHDEVNISDDIIHHLDACHITPKDIISQFSCIEKFKTFNLRMFTNFIDDLWIRVNSYINQISNEVGNVHSELILMWEIFLLGRDELFQEFLLKGGHLLSSDITVVTARNLNVVLKDAVYNVYLSENCNFIDSFYFKLPNRRAIKLGLTVWSVMYLDYKVKWPLEYLFTPEVLNLYNKVFSFLLRLKKAQMDLTTTCKGINYIHHHSVKMEFIEVKIHLLSIVSNLQNYCLTYVIANEMNLLLSKVKKTTLFTELQKSLLLFLTNISDRLFLNQVEDVDKNITSHITGTETVNIKINKCFMKIFDLCGSFSELMVRKMNENVISELKNLKIKLYEILKLMFSLLLKIDQNLYHNQNDSLHVYTYLYQLMMCLDYNNFYQNKFQFDIGE
ncbi:gamma-tubulin complex component 4 [Halyomorpha halys]|uniref:gamma-tubulin complex component 4 n=1 Tax=Halyomorpha halys TaxID=286706 RepID=UPI000D0C80CF|nr:gamma-tubulin complex component 4-like [Halyomorpha halys]